MKFELFFLGKAIFDVTNSNGCSAMKIILSILNWCWQSVTLMWFEETETNKIYLKIMILFNHKR